MPRKRVEAHQVKLNGKPVWRVIIPVDVTGGRRKIRLFQKKTEAVDFANHLEDTRRGVAGQLASMPHHEQSEIMRAIRILGDQVDTLPLAAEYWIKTHPSPANQKTVADVCSECWTSKELNGCRPRYLRQLKSVLGKFCLSFGGRGICDVTANEVDGWLNGFGWAQATKRSFLIDIRSLYSFAISRGYAGLNVAEQVTKPKTDDKPPGILTPGQTAALMHAAQKHDPRLCGYLALCLFAGLRPAEAENTKPDRILDDWIEVQAETSKTRRRRLVAIMPNLKAWLELPADMPPRNLVRRLRKVRSLAQIPWSHDCMRHSFASYHLALFQSADKTAHEMGHGSTQMLFGHYRQLVTKKDAEEYFSVLPTVTPPKV